MGDSYSDFSDEPLRPDELKITRKVIQRQQDRDAFDRAGGRAKIIAGWIGSAIVIWSAWEFVIKAAVAP